MINDIDVSIIIPIYNGNIWINDCFNSILSQTALENNLKIEISIYNDGSVDETLKTLAQWQQNIHAIDNLYLIIGNGLFSKGVGYAKNQAVKQSKGKFLCFQDIDDIMLPDRIQLQYNIAKKNINALIGCKFERDPPNSTSRYTRWANNLNENQLYLQIYTSHGPTLIMPTWFCHRDIFYRIEGFSELGRGTPEDLIFFYKHLDFGGELYRVNHVLINYKYHLQATTFSINEETIWKIRIKRLEEKILKHWNKFTIWNAGKQGKKLFRYLKYEYRNRVQAFCDVDGNKIGKFYEPYQIESTQKRIPIVHFTNSKSPYIICVKMDMTNGMFEENLKSMNLTEGIDYIHFN